MGDCTVGMKADSLSKKQGAHVQYVLLYIKHELKALGLAFSSIIIIEDIWLQRFFTGSWCFELCVSEAVPYAGVPFPIGSNFTAESFFKVKVQMR